MFIPFVGLRSALTSRLANDDTVLPLDSATIALLTKGFTDASDYTRLQINDGYTEIVKVVSITNGAVIVQRAQEGTSAAAFRQGACASFIWTTANLTDFFGQGMGGAQPSVCAIKAGSDRVRVSMDQCIATVDTPACTSTSWRAGNQEFIQQAGGCVTATPLIPGLLDGQYDNASITITNGYITAIHSGTNIVYSTTGGCGGSGGGSVGPEGPQGPQGQPGIQGPPGPKGAPGDTGTPGEKGDKGDPGTPGKDGLSMQSGASAPSAGLGNIGDFYIDTTADALYGPKTAQGWGAAVPLKGEKGDPGDKGNPGDKGDPGPKGDPGATGTPGKDGKAANWTVVQYGASNIIYIIGPVGETFSLENLAGASLYTDTIPPSGRISYPYTPTQTQTKSIFFLKSNNLYVGAAEGYL